MSKLYQPPLRICSKGKLDSVLLEEWKENVQKNHHPGKAHTLILGLQKPDALVSVKKRKSKKRKEGMEGGGQKGGREGERQEGKRAFLARDNECMKAKRKDYLLLPIPLDQDSHILLRV